MPLLPSSPSRSNSSSKFNPSLFTKGAESTGGGSGKNLLSRLAAASKGGSDKSLLSRLTSSIGSPGSKRSPKHSSPKACAVFSAVPFSCSASTNAFLEAARSLATAAANDPSLVVNFGFVPPLVSLMRPGAATDACAISAAKALASLASHRENHAAIREAGAVPVLMLVLTSTKSSAAVVLGALEVLRPLSRDADSKEMLRDAGAFRPLLSAL